MFLWCFIFGLIIRSINRTWAIIIAIVVAGFLNGVLGPLLLGIIDLLPMQVAKGLVIVLVIASIINAAIAGIAIRIFSRRDLPGI